MPVLTINKKNILDKYSKTFSCCILTVISARFMIIISLLSQLTYHQNVMMPRWKEQQRFLQSKFQVCILCHMILPGRSAWNISVIRINSFMGVLLFISFLKHLGCTAICQTKIIWLKIVNTCSKWWRNDAMILKVF